MANLIKGNQMETYATYMQAFHNTYCRGCEGHSFKSPPTCTYTKNVVYRDVGRGSWGDYSPPTFKLWLLSPPPPHFNYWV